jgi:predicted nucleic acid-binding protein
VTRFFDTNILVYAYSDDPRAAIARALLSEVTTYGGAASVQILNELANVLLRKFKLPWDEVDRAIANARRIFGLVFPITEATHEVAMGISRQHGLSVYDALVVASALEAGCDQLLSEDLQHGQRFGALTIVNPFV